MMIKFAVCGDDQKDLNKLCKIIYEYSDINNSYISVDSFSSVKKLLLSNKNYDCYIMDVVIENEFSGITLSKQIKNANPDVKIIIISSNIVFAKDAVNIHADYFILKPIERSEVFSALDNSLSEFSDSIITIIDNQNVKRNLPLAKIVYIETYKRITRISLTENKFVIAKVTIAKWEEKLNHNLFVRCHRGLIVNVKHIKAINGEEIYLNDQRFVYASRRCKDDVRNKFYSYMDRKFI